LCGPGEKGLRDNLILRMMLDRSPASFLLHLSAGSLP
jgi:hypothetical protein